MAIVQEAKRRPTDSGPPHHPQEVWVVAIAVLAYVVSREVITVSVLVRAGIALGGSAIAYVAIVTLDPGALEHNIGGPEFTHAKWGVLLLPTPAAPWRTRPARRRTSIAS